MYDNTFAYLFREINLKFGWEKKSQGYFSNNTRKTKYLIQKLK